MNYQTKRLAYFVAVAAFVVAVTGAFAAKYYFKPPMGCSDRLGRTWHLTGAFQGQIEILDATGKTAGTFSKDFGDMQESIEIETAGERFAIQGVGRHEIISKNGLLYGFAILRPVTKQAFLARMNLDHIPSRQESLEIEAQSWDDAKWDAHSAISSVQSFPWGVRGFDRGAALSWKVSGKGTVRLVDGVSKTTLAAGVSNTTSLLQNVSIPASIRTLLDSKEPEITVSYGKMSWKAKGFGKHELKDERGDVALFVELEPQKSEE